MKTILYISLFIGLLVKAKNASCQDIKKLDTIYYLVDTSKTFVKDRIIKITDYPGGYYKVFTINAPCFTGYFGPTFGCHCSIDSGKIISESAARKLNLINLSKLIDLACQDNTGDMYNQHFVTYFLEPYKDGYIQHKVQMSSIIITR